MRLMLRLFLTALFLFPAAALADTPEIGQPAPAFSVQDISGQTQSLARYKGSVVVMEWSNPGCPFVRKHYGSGNMQSLQRTAREKGVVWLTVNSSAPGKQGNMTVEQAKNWVAEMKASPSAYILDAKGTLGRLYGAKATPHMFVIDPSGRLAYAGAIDDKPSFDQGDVKTADNYVMDAVNALLAGKPVAVASTRAYGCSVKYED
ncbi:MAG: thioredoxin family protein [Alphaproteobacteria bacterium]|nr:thioredoxin family protein [Alphaproteobacteria bacterium]